MSVINRTIEMLRFMCRDECAAYEKVKLQLVHSPETSIIDLDIFVYSFEVSRA